MATRATNGRAVRAIREALGISQAELAAAAGIDRTTLWKIETSGAQPRPQVQRKIADRLGVGLDVITYPVAEGAPEGATA